MISKIPSSDEARALKTRRADDRSDFVRRLFAIAISVGAATTITRMRWLQTGSIPDTVDQGQLSLLLAGLVATVSSWDGYFASITEKPLRGQARYVIDITLVFGYMLLLLSSAHGHIWSGCLAAIFVLYVVWDFLTVVEFPDIYDSDNQVSGFPATVRSVGRVYLFGATDEAGCRKGPIITVCWAAYFILLSVFYWKSSMDWQNFYFAMFAIFGLVAYRTDKEVPGAGNIRGFSMKFRAALILTLLVYLKMGSWSLDFGYGLPG